MKFEFRDSQQIVWHETQVIGLAQSWITGNYFRDPLQGNVITKTINLLSIEIFLIRLQAVMTNKQMILNALVLVTILFIRTGLVSTKKIPKSKACCNFCTPRNIVFKSRVISSGKSVTKLSGWVKNFVELCEYM